MWLTELLVLVFHSSLSSPPALNSQPFTLGLAMFLALAKGMLAEVMQVEVWDLLWRLDVLSCASDTVMTEYILGICCHCNLSLKMRHEHPFPQPIHMPAVGATLVNTSRSLSGPGVSLPFLGCGSGNLKKSLHYCHSNQETPTQDSHTESLLTFCQGLCAIG